MISQRTRVTAILALVAALAATVWTIRERVTDAPRAGSSDPALERLSVRDGEQNPLLIGDAIAGNADIWRSSRERKELERRALAGDASAAFELWKYYNFTTHDEASGRRWLTLAARGGHEVAQFNLAVEIGASDCDEAKSRLRRIADLTSNAETRSSALSWIGDPLLCEAKGPTD